MSRSQPCAGTVKSSATAVLVATVSAMPVVEYTKVLPGTVKPSHLLMGRPAMVPVPPVGCVMKAPLLYSASACADNATAPSAITANTFWNMRATPCRAKAARAGMPANRKRETGLEPATCSLEGCRSTTELLPQRGEV